MPKKPSVTEYLSVHHYLNDLYKYRKQTEPDFSYELWAQELDFKNRSFLRQIVTGRRGLTSDTAKQLAVRLNFQGIERQYFDLLVQYSRARSLEKQSLLGRELMSLLKSEHSQQEIEDYCEFVSATLYPKLQTLLSFKDVRKTPEHLAPLLRKSPEEITNALKILERINLATQEDDEEWKSVPKSFKVPEAIGDRNLLEYHALSLREAIEARSLPKEQRRYLSLILPLNQQDFAAFWEEFNKFKKDMIRKFDVEDLRDRQLFQMNLNIYAVSEEMVDSKIDPTPT
ncbi:TIGR02147 family protein [Bdellovibrio sp. NC01]|uniref:TIGR02147 family protein n=1 Tax=Bdellovibrio sp. NC01 TaxID=2220073 RepID=UPI00143CE21C|nr:TIGR02147 family protein [Bdellovibrio sp. NC01]